MGGLRDQLKKANVLSEQEARRLAHEERVERKEVGRGGLEQKQRKRQAELEALREAERGGARAAQQELDRERRDAAERAACDDLLRSDVVRPPRGQQKWYFELEDQSLPYFEVDEALRFQLQSGAYWVVRTGGRDSHAYGLLPVELGKRVVRALPEVVAWVPGGPRALAAARRGG